MDSRAARPRWRSLASRVALAHHSMPLEDGAAGYDLFKNKKDGCVRSVFQPSA